MQNVHMSLERHHIDLLVALHTHGQLGNAAAALNLSPSAASHRLKEAERRLGIALTVARGRTVALTPAAVHLAEVGEASQRANRSAENTARWIATASRSAVRIAFDFYDTAPWFEQLIALPGLPTDVDFVRVGYDDVGHAIEQQRADLGVVAAAPTEFAPHGQAFDVLCEDELVGVVHNDHPAAERGELVADDISRSWYLTAGDRPSRGFEHHGFFEPAGVQPHRLRKVESLAMILRLLRAFGGVTVQPLIAVQAAPLHDLCIVPLRGVTIPIVWHLVMRDDVDDVVQMANAIRELVSPHRQ